MQTSFAAALTIIGCAFIGLITYAIPADTTTASPHAIDYLLLYAVGFIGMFNGLLMLIWNARAR